jgi:outer membrane protein OmpA-like peptidoglycan-associated protein
MRRAILFAAVAMVAVGCTTAKSTWIIVEPRPVAPRAVVTAPTVTSPVVTAPAETPPAVTAPAVTAPVVMDPGVTGPRGPYGPSGPAGTTGATGAQDMVGVVEGWTSFREFVFDYDRSDMQAADHTSIDEIASYMRQHPSLQLGIDGSMDPRGNDPHDQSLSNRRVNAVRDALIQAGVPSHKIQAGAFGDTRLTRDRRVEVLISTSR